MLLSRPCMVTYVCSDKPKNYIPLHEQNIQGFPEIGRRLSRQTSVLADAREHLSSAACSNFQ